MKDAMEILERLSSAMREGRLLSGMLRRFSGPEGSHVNISTGGH